MKMLQFLTIVSTLIIAYSCSSISKEDCKRDMYQFGLDQGYKGASNLAEDIKRVCSSDSVTVDLLNYEKGFNIGWDVYCSPTHGLENGMKGELYKSFCPSTKEDHYHASFLIGKKIYEKKDQLQELEDKLREVEKEDSTELPVKDELKQLKEEVVNLNREIQSLEQAGRK